MNRWVICYSPESRLRSVDISDSDFNISQPLSSFGIFTGPQYLGDAHHRHPRSHYDHPLAGVQFVFPFSLFLNFFLIIFSFCHNGPTPSTPCSRGVNEQVAAMPISSVQQAPTEGGMSGLFLPLTFLWTFRYFPLLFVHLLAQTTVQYVSSIQWEWHVQNKL